MYHNLNESMYAACMIDSHCHLADKQFDSDLDAVLLRAEEHGIDTMICIADNFEEAEKCLELAEKYDQLFCTIGVHPHEAKHWKDTDEDRLKRMIASSHKAKAVGEIGLDYHYDNSPRDVQQSVFKKQLEIAKELDLPAVIHNRESIDDLKKIVWDIDPPSAVLHCCTEKWEDVSDWVERGLWLSFTGIVTYPKPDWIAEVIQHCPLEQIMIETDAPYLAPVPYRGKRNEPAYVVEVAKKIAELKGLTLEMVDTQTTANTIAFYQMGS